MGRTPPARSRPARRGGGRSTPRWSSSSQGLKVPSPHWRRQWSLLLGLDRLLSQDEPHLVDGTVLSAHQVDALSGTLTALLADRLKNGDAAAPRSRSSTTWRRAGHPGRGGPRRRGRARGADGLGGLGARRRRRGRRRGARGSERRQALLVRARDRRGQDRRRRRLRRGLADRRHPDPHPPPQPRRPVPRRAARPRLRQADRARAARPRGHAERPGDGRDLPVVRPQRRQRLGRVRDRHLRRGAHRAGREDLGRDPRLDRPGVRRHDRDRRADRPPRHRPLPDPDVALRPRAGRAPRRHLAAALRPDPARTGRAHDRQGAVAPRRGRHRVRPGDAGRTARSAAVQPGRRRPLQDPLQRRARRRLLGRCAPRLQRRRRRSATPG